MNSRVTRATPAGTPRSQSRMTREGRKHAYQAMVYPALISSSVKHLKAFNEAIARGFVCARLIHLQIACSNKHLSMSKGTHP